MSVSTDLQQSYARARQARDPRFDGLFFVAVRSTKIYCRPICPAPTALERNVQYFRCAAAAAAAGFRPCLRCRPELAPGMAPCDGVERGFERAWQRIRDGALIDASLAELAEQLGVGERQLRRQFVQRLGVGPQRVHANQRLLLARQLLTETSLSVTEIAFASGFQSLRRFNHAFQQACGMAPTRLRQGLRPVAGPLRLKLAYRPPYAFQQILQFLAVRALPGLEWVDGNSYWRLIGPAAAPSRIQVAAIPGEHALSLSLQPSALAQLPQLIRRVRRLFDLDAQPESIAAVLGADQLLQPGLAAVPGRRVPGAFDGFETAVRAVLGQQVSVAAARTLCQRLLVAFGTPVASPDEQPAHLFPDPQRLVEADLSGIGLPSARAATVRGLARAACAGQLDLEHMQALDSFVEQICELPGIGPWTAHYIAMRCLHHPDAFPAGDLVIRKFLGAEQPLTTREAERRAENWRPWRAYAVLELWGRSTERPSLETSHETRAES